MPLVKRILFNGRLINIDILDRDVINANNPSDINGEQFKVKNKPASANTIRVLKNYLESIKIPTGALVFDTVPTEGSLNPVTSEGIKEYIDYAIEAYISSKFIVLTEEEYESLEIKDPGKFYMIVEQEYIQEDDS